MKNISIFFMLLILLASCASSRKVAEPVDQVPKAAKPYDESFDPLSLNDNDVVIQQEKKTATQVIQKTKKTTVSEPAVEALNETKEVDGFRVQILATKNIESATTIQQTAADQFRSMNHKSYLVYESPQYKVRIGDVVTRSEAEEIRNMARDLGYKGAFIVRSKVDVPKLNK